MQLLKLNLGCGRNVLPGWVNIDNSPSVLLTGRPWVKKTAHALGVITKEQLETNWPADIVWRDLTKRWPYGENTVDRIYSSHFLEHLSRDEGEAVLREACRALKPEGLFRLVVPDLVFHATRYLRKVAESDGVGREPHDEFLRNIYGAFLEKRRKGLHHKYMYDWFTLRFLLKSVGFSSVVRQSYQVSADEELARLDNRPEDSLHIDARK